jgi:antitoxin YefM
MTMEVTNFSDARKNLKSVFDRVVENADVTLITRRNGENVVLMSEEEYNSMNETLYLLSSPANAKHIKESISQLEHGEHVEYDPTV